MLLRYLRTLVTIADSGGFSSAGNLIGLTQSAVSLHVKALEEDFGEPLFDRSARPPVLTPRGKELVWRARTIVRLTAELKDGPEESGDGEYVGLIKIGVIPSVLSTIFPQALANLRKEYSGLKIVVKSHLGNEIIEELVKNKIDIALMLEPTAPTSGVTFQPLHQDSLVIVSRYDIQGMSVKEIFETAPYIRFNHAEYKDYLIEAALREMGASIVSDIEVDSMDAILKFVAAGAGVSVVPARILSNVENDSLHVVPLGAPPLLQTIGLATNDSVFQGAIVRRFGSILSNVMQNHPIPDIRQI